MSYILDALRRADRERERHEPRSLVAKTASAAPPHPSHPSRILLPIITVAAIVVAITAWLPGDETPTVAMPTQEASPRSTPVEAAVATTEPGTQESTPSSVQVAQPPPKSPPPTAPRMRAAEAIAVVAVQPQSTEQVGTDENRPLSSTVDRTTTEMPRKAAAPTVVAWRDLPHEQRKGLPRPHLDVHVHADDPSGRFVMVGMRKYREGDTLPDGSLLERILADGVQLEFRGQHYRLPRR